MDWANFDCYDNWSGESPYHRSLDPGNKSLIPHVTFITSDSTTVPSLQTLCKIRVAILFRDRYQESCWPYNEEKYLDRIHNEGQPLHISFLRYIRCGDCCPYIYKYDPSTKYYQAIDKLNSSPLPMNLKDDVRSLLYNLVIKGDQMRGLVTLAHGCEPRCYISNRHSYSAILTNDYL